MAPDLREIAALLVVASACAPRPAPAVASEPPVAPATSAEPAPPESEPEAQNGGSWTFDVHGRLEENECPDEEDEDCEHTVAHWRVVATDAAGHEREVHSDAAVDWYDDVWGAFEPVEGLADPNVQMLNLIADVGEDFSRRELVTLLVRLDPERGTMKILYEGDGSSSSDMGECIEYDVIGFRATAEGNAVEVLRSQAIEFVDQGMDQDCDPSPLEQEVLERISLQTD